MSVRRLNKLGVALVYDSALLGYLPVLRKESIDLLEVGLSPAVSDRFPLSFVERAKTLGLSLGCHLPFVINLGREENKNRSSEYLAKGLRLADMLDGVAVFHPGYYGGRDFEQLRVDLLEILEQTLSRVPHGKGKLGIETTGRTTEIGTVDEVLSLVKGIDSERLVPVIDFAHIYARTLGKFPKCLDDFTSVLDKIETELAPQRFHLHVSGIEYGKGGEKRHRSVKTCAPALPYLIQALKQTGIEFHMVIESPDPVGDLAWIREVLDDPTHWFTFAEEQQHKSQLNVLDAYFGQSS